MAKKSLWDVMLIAPVGTRDVTLTDLSLLPDDESRQAWNHADPRLRTGARDKGTVLLGDPDRYFPALSLDILGKAVRHVFARHGHVDRLVLVASRQGDDVPERYRKNDTMQLACVVRDLLRRDGTLHKVGEATKILPIAGNPANYEVMRAFYREHLPAWTQNLGEEGLCYLEVTGGTAQMSTMLLLEGVRLLRTRAVPLYVLEDLDMPQTLDVGREMLVDSLRQTLVRDLSIYAYHAAWQSVVAEEAVLRPSVRHYDALRAVLDAARHRLNLNLGGAQAALFGADRGLPVALAGRVLQLASELGPQGRTPAWLMAEVYHSATVRYRTEAYASFVGRLFRFQEAMLRYLCERWGARFGGDHDAVLDPGWLAGHPRVGRALASAKIDVQKPVNRRALCIVARRLARAAGDEAGLGWLARLERLEKLAALRNRSVIAHGFAGISRDDLNASYPGGASQIEADVAGLLVDVLGLDVSTNPYDAINALCLTLLDGGTP